MYRDDELQRILLENTPNARLAFAPACEVYAYSLLPKISEIYIIYLFHLMILSIYLYCICFSIFISTSISISTVTNQPTAGDWVMWTAMTKVLTTAEKKALLDNLSRASVEESH